MATYPPTHDAPADSPHSLERPSSRQAPSSSPCRLQLQGSIAFGGGEKAAGAGGAGNLQSVVSADAAAQAGRRTTGPPAYQEQAAETGRATGRALRCTAAASRTRDAPPFGELGPGLVGRGGAGPTQGLGRTGQGTRSAIGRGAGRRGRALAVATCRGGKESWRCSRTDELSAAASAQSWRKPAHVCVSDAGKWPPP